MASPVNKRYSVASGQPIYAGRFVLPASNSGLAMLTISSSTSGTKPFSVGHAFKQGDVPAGLDVVLSGVTSGQVTVKNRWPDGSVKFAIAAGRVALSAGVPLLVAVGSGTAPSGTPLSTSALQLVMTSPAVIDVGSYGTVSWSGTDWASPFMTVCTGPVMSQWVYRKPVGSDPHLVAWLRVRLYSSGEVDALPWVENSKLLVASPTSKAGTYAFTMGGTVRYTGTIDLPAQCRTPLLSGTGLSHWLGTDPDVDVLHDTDYLQATGLFSQYFARTPSNAAVVTSLPSSWAPLQQGKFPSALGGVGGNGYVGLLPDWDVVYLTCPQASTFKGVVRQAYSAGRYPIHYRDETDSNRWARVSQHPTLDYQTIPGVSPGGTAAPPWSGDHPPSVGYMAHLITGDAYHLDTVLAATSFDSFIAISAGNRQNGSGITCASQFAGSTRRAAWVWRNLAHALTLAPDTTYATEYRTQLTNNVNYYWTRYVGAGGWQNPVGNKQGFVQPFGSYNLNVNGAVTASTTTTASSADPAFTYYHNVQDGQYVGLTLHAIGVGESRTITAFDAASCMFTVSPAFSSAPAIGSPIEVIYGTLFDAPWMHDYLTGTMGWTLDLGCGFDSTTQARMEELFKWKAQSIIGRLGFTGSTEFLYRDFAPYALPIAKFDYPNDNAWATGAGPWFDDWGQIYDKTYSGTAVNDNLSYWPWASRGARAEGDLRNDGLMDPQGSPAAALPAIAYAVKHGVPGAEDALMRMQSAGNYSAFAALFDTSPTWGVSHMALPAWRRNQAIGEIREISGTKMNPSLPNVNIVEDLVGWDHDIANPIGGRYSNRLDGYCGWTFDERRSTGWTAAAGGHGDYWGNEMANIDLRKDRPTWFLYHPGSNGPVLDYASSNEPAPAWRTRYADGLPASRHTYAMTQFLGRHNRAVTTGGSISSPGTPFQDTDGFDVDAGVGVNGWSELYAYPGGQGGVGPATWSGGGAIIAATCVKDPRTEKIYTFSHTRLHILTPSVTGPIPGVAGSGATYSYLPLSWDSAYSYAEGAAAVDTKRNKILWTHGYGLNSKSKPYTFDLTSGTLDAQHTYTGSAAAALATVPSSCGVVYEPFLDRYLLRGPDAGAAIYVIHPETFDVSLLTTSGATDIPAQAGSGAEGYTGVYNKWAYVPHLRGVVYVVGAGFNLRFIRTH
jgi:hypothetical protein